MNSLIRLIYRSILDKVQKPFTYTYVEEVVKDIKSTLHKSAIRQELNNHMDESIQYYLDQGFSQDDAYSLSVDAMGSSQEVSDQFNEVYSWHYTLFFISKVIALISIIGFSIYSIQPLLQSYSSQKNTNNYSSLEIQSLESRTINESIQFGEVFLNFDKVYLLDENQVMLHYKARMRNPFIKRHLIVRLDTKCGDYDCYYSPFYALKDASNANIYGQFIYINNLDSIPESINITLRNLSDKTETFTLQLGASNHE